jgi:hypothetical protein
LSLSNNSAFVARLERGVEKGFEVFEQEFTRIQIGATKGDVDPA